MSKNRKYTQTSASNKRRIELSHSPDDPSQNTGTPRIRIPAKKKQHTYEDELTFTELVDYNSSPGYASSDDVGIPASILNQESRPGARVTPSAKVAYMSGKSGHIPARTICGTVGNDEDNHPSPRSAHHSERYAVDQRGASRRTSRNDVDQLNHAADRRRPSHQEEEIERAGYESESDLVLARYPGNKYVLDRRSRHATASKFISHADGRDHNEPSEHDLSCDELPVIAKKAPINYLSIAPKFAFKHADKSFSDAGRANRRRDRDSFNDRRSRRSPSPDKSHRGRSRTVRDHDGGSSQFNDVDNSKNKIDKGKQSASRGDGAGNNTRPYSPEWDMVEEDAGLFSTDEDREKRLTVKNRTARIAADHDGEDARAPGKNIVADLAEGNKQRLDTNVENADVNNSAEEDKHTVKQAEHVYDMDDHVEESLPPLINCEMRTTFVPANAAQIDPYFFDLNQLIPDMQDQELKLIESAHKFSYAVPFANIAVCNPYCFDIDQGFRLVWNKAFLKRKNPTFDSDKARNVVGIMIGAVVNANLKKAITLGFKAHLTRRIGINPTEMALKRVVRMMGTKLEWPAVKVSLDSNCIVNFSVKGVSNTTSTPTSTARRYARSAQSTTTEPIKDNRGISSGFYPNVLDFNTEVKVYDARGTDFVFDEEHLGQVHQLPEYDTFSEDKELNSQCIVAVAYTLNAYGIPATKPESIINVKDCPSISTNVQFVVVLGITPF